MNNQFMRVKLVLFCPNALIVKEFWMAVFGRDWVIAQFCLFCLSNVKPMMSWTHTQETTWSTRLIFVIIPGAVIRPGMSILDQNNKKKTLSKF